MQEATNPAMAKRARGSVRPGQRRPTSRRPASSAAAPAPTAATPSATASTTAKPSGLSDAELERAAVLEAQLLAEEKAAEQSRKRGRDRTPARPVAGPAGTIAMRAEVEYAYVGRDLRKILKVAALEAAILVVLYLLIDVTKVVSIGG